MAEVGSVDKIVASSGKIKLFCELPEFLLPRRFRIHSAVPQLDVI
jgi:hypothetical protein